MRVRGWRQLPPRRDGLPGEFTPRSAAYAHGPMIETPDEVRASSWSWRSNRTYVVRFQGHDYRAVRVYSQGELVGYWAVEMLGVPLPLSEWE